jgi:hypothetical protein
MHSQFFSFLIAWAAAASAVAATLLHMSNTHVKYTCQIHMSNTHVKYTCQIHMSNMLKTVLNGLVGTLSIGLSGLRPLLAPQE